MRFNKHDIFLASPMSGFPADADYREHRTIVLEAIETLKECGARNVYYAGVNAPASGRFVEPAQAMLADVRALQSSSAFVMIYPDRIVSSVLVEIGIAIALEIPCFVFVRRREDLPYLLLHAGEFGGTDGLPAIHVFEYAGRSALKKAIHSIKAELMDAIQLEGFEWNETTGPR